MNGTTMNGQNLIMLAVESLYPLEYVASSSEFDQAMQTTIVLLHAMLRYNIDIDHQDSWGETILVYATLLHLQTFVRILLDYGVSLDTRGRLTGRTPYEDALFVGCASIARDIEMEKRRRRWKKFREHTRYVQLAHTLLNLYKHVVHERYRPGGHGAFAARDHFFHMANQTSVSST